MKTLVVINPFGGRDKGHEITDPGEIETVLGGEHAHHVVAVEKPETETEE